MTGWLTYMLTLISDMTIESIIGYAIQFGSAIAVLYVSYRILQLKVWFKDEMANVKVEMTKAIKENCAGKVEFEAHARTDEVFQKNLMEDIGIKRAEYAKHNAAHYQHAANTGIHQESMSADVLKEKFENVKSQVADVQARVQRLTEAIERSGG